MIKNARAPLVQSERWNDYFLLTFEAPGIAREARPGQFLMIKVSPEPYPLLRRPLSIHGRSGDAVEVFFKVAGSGTEILSRKKPGETADILGPLGRGYRLDGDLRGKKAWCVGGGRGIAPLNFLAEELRALGAEVRIFYGGRSVEDLPLRDKFEKRGFPAVCSTDDGTFGFHGFVTDLLEKEGGAAKPDSLYVCGPDAMMEAVAKLSRVWGVPAEFSLESLMGCGIGACWGCVKRIKKEGSEGWVKICEDGPVFARDEIVWPGDVP